MVREGLSYEADIQFHYERYAGQVDCICGATQDDSEGWLDILAAKMTSIEHAVGAQIRTVIQCAVHAFFLSSEGFIL